MNALWAAGSHVKQGVEIHSRLEDVVCWRLVHVVESTLHHTSGAIAECPHDGLVCERRLLVELLEVAQHVAALGLAVWFAVSEKGTRSDRGCVWGGMKPLRGIYRDERLA